MTDLASTTTSVAQDTLSKIEAFCARTGMSETAFGKAVAGDGHLVRRLRDDESMTIKRLDKVLAFIRDYPNVEINGAVTANDFMVEPPCEVPGVRDEVSGPALELRRAG